MTEEVGFVASDAVTLRMVSQSKNRRGDLPDWNRARPILISSDYDRPSYRSGRRVDDLQSIVIQIDGLVLS